MQRREFLRASLATAVSGTMSSADTVHNRTEKVNPRGKTEIRSAFLHPGIIQTTTDLESMKRHVIEGDEPWASKWNALLEKPFSSLSFEPRPVAHIVRSAYGREPVGVDELRASVDAAHSHVLQWYVTGKQEHAEKAADILDAWSKVLWEFDGNDAKLLAGWTGATLCETAEILRATYPKWGEAREQRFRQLLTGVYLPLESDLFPEANGNWDGAMMHTLAAIAIFMDDTALFEKVTTHYKYGRGNGGIAKYIYPTGQCEESTRDMGHTQLGLGYFALTAHIAWSQGVDLFSLAENRMALGFEYTSKYLLGEDVPCYGEISGKGRGQFSDFYEAAYQHYRYVQGRTMPYTEKAMSRAREHATSTLILYRGETPRTPHLLLAAPDVPKARLSGAQADSTPAVTSEAVQIRPGEPIQAALNGLGSKGGVVYLEAGIHTLPATLRMYSRITLAGAGRKTILVLAPQVTGYCIEEGEANLHDVVLRDFILEGFTSAGAPFDPNEDRRSRSISEAISRGGIRIAGDRDGSMSKVHMERLTVRNCTLGGVLLDGVAGVSIVNCDFSDNGGSVSPGAGQHHNLRLHHCRQADLRGSRLDTSIAGCGLKAWAVEGLSIEGCEAARNRLDGFRFSDCARVTITESLAEGNDGHGIDFRPGTARNNLPMAKSNILRLNGAEVHVE